MTLPIIPGPFSFLPKAAQAFASYTQAKDQKKQRDLQQDSTRFFSILDDVRAGLLEAKTMSTPSMMALAAKIGIDSGVYSPGNMVARPQERLARGQDDVISQILGGQDKDAESFVLNTGKVPTTADRLGQKEAGMRLADISRPGQTPAQRSAVTGVPGAASALAGEESRTIPILSAHADRFVRALYTRTGKLDAQTAIQAYNEALQETGSHQDYMQQNLLTKTYFEDAVRRLTTEVEGEKNKRLTAERGANADRMRDIKAQIDDLRQQTLQADSEVKAMEAAFNAPTNRVVAYASSGPDLVKRRRAEQEIAKRKREVAALRERQGPLDVEYENLRKLIGPTASREEPGVAAPATGQPTPEMRARAAFWMAELQKQGLTGAKLRAEVVAKLKAEGFKVE